MTRHTGRPALPPGTRKQVLTVRVPPATLELLDRAKDQMGLSRGEITELALGRFLRGD